MVYIFFLVIGIGFWMAGVAVRKCPDARNYAAESGV
jgi:hypothetical protein